MWGQQASLATAARMGSSMLGVCSWKYRLYCNGNNAEGRAHKQLLLHLPVLNSLRQPYRA